MRERLRGSRVLRALRALGYALPYELLVRLVRRRPARFLFLSDSHDGFTGNMAFLARELRRARPDAEIIGVFKAGLRARRSLRDTLRLPYLIASSGTIVLDDYYPLVYPLRIRPDARLIQVWHAAGAFKQVGHSRAGLPGGPVPGSRIHRNYTDATVSSEAIRRDYAEAYGIDLSRVHALGVPRTDAFFDTDRIARVRAQIRDRLGVAQDERLVLFAPTFRGNGQLSAMVDETADWGRIATELGPGYRVCVRQHPFAQRFAAPLAENVLDGAGDEMNDLLMAVDILVTDYSSSIFEFALLRRPIILFAPDLHDYAGSRDFYRPFDAYATGAVIEDPDLLADAIRGARVDEERLDRFLEEFCSALDGRSTARIVQELLLTRPEDDPRRADVVNASVAPGGSAPTPTRVSSAIGLSVMVAHIARISLALVYAPLKLMPARRKVVMISREHPTVPQDFADLAAAIRRLDPTIRIVTLVRMVPPGAVGKIGYAAHMLRQLLHVATARVLIVDTYAIVASVLRHKPSLTVIQMWHALGAFKRFGRSILGQEEGRDARLAQAMRMHEGYDLVLASADAARAPFAEALNTPIDRVVVAPLPRVDRLRDPARGAQTRARILAAHPHLDGARVALFAPTFRLDGAVSVDPAALRDALHAAGWHLVVKLHPLMAGHFGADIDTAPGFSTQDVIHIADLFITDYSSALYEAALVDVPSVFLAPDLDDYLASRDFYLDYRRDLPGPVVGDVAGVVAALDDLEAVRARTAAFARRWIEIPGDEPAKPGSTPCADRIARLVVDAVGSAGR